MESDAIPATYQNRPTRNKHNSSSRLHSVIGVFSLFLTVAVLVRLPHLSDRSIWYDEASSWQMSQFSMPELWYACKLNVHPPLYYLVLKLWRTIYGDSPVALRSLSILWSVIAIAGLFILGWMLGDQGIETPWGETNLHRFYCATISSALFALSAFQVNSAIEARMYSMGTALALWAAVVTVRVIRGASGVFWIILGVLMLGALYTHHYCIFLVAAKIVTLGIWSLAYGFTGHNNLARKQFCALALGVGLGFVPGIILLSTQVARVSQDYWTVPLNAELVLQTFSEFWQPVKVTDSSTVGTIVIALSTGATLAAIRRKVLEIWLVVLCAWLPMLLGGLVSLLVTPVWEGRFFRFSEPFLLMTVALGIRRLSPHGWSWVVGSVIVGVVACGTWFFWRSRQIDDRGGIRAAAAFLLENSGENELVVATSNVHYFPAKYYIRGQRQVKLFRDSVRQFWGHHLIRPHDLVGIREILQARKNGIWVISHSSHWKDLPLTGKIKPRIQRVFHYDYGVPQWDIYVTHILSEAHSEIAKDGPLLFGQDYLLTNRHPDRGLTEEVRR